MRIALIIFVAVLSFVVYRFVTVDLNGNNTCKNFEDYYDVQNSENCWYSEDNQLNTLDLIRKYAGIAESHEVTTEDGFILTLHRIRRREAKGVILLEHPIALDSQVYMMQGNESTELDTMFGWEINVEAFTRQNTSISKSLIQDTGTLGKVTVFTELGNDLSSKIKYIRSNTDGSKVIYFGQSVGTTIALAYASMRPEEARDSIKVFILASPLFRYEHLPTAHKYFARALLTFYSLFPCTKVDSDSTSKFLRYAHRAFPSLLMMNYKISLYLYGNPESETDASLFNFDVLSLKRTFSCQQSLHSLQLTTLETRFQMFDYGPARNKEAYGTDSPPLYPLWNITAPVYTISGTNDYLTTPEDAKELYKILPDTAKIYGSLEIPGFNHVDYHTGKRRKEAFIDKVLEFLDNILTEK